MKLTQKTVNDLLAQLGPADSYMYLPGDLDPQGMVAARLRAADETVVRLCGQGIRDVTRIAASDPRMWIEILSANPGPVAEVLAAVAADLEKTVESLRALQSADEAKRRGGHPRRPAPGQRGPGQGTRQARRGARLL